MTVMTASRIRRVQKCLDLHALSASTAHIVERI